MSDHISDSVSTNDHPAYGSDAHLLWALEQLGQVLACRGVRAVESPWVNRALDVSISHPDPRFRARLATSCSLRQLRRLATDDEVLVRRSCARNPFVIDLDIQLVLAADSDARVVHRMLNTCDPYREVVPVLLASPHRSVRKRLLGLNLLDDLLLELSRDPDPEISLFAALTLQFRHDDLAEAR